MLLNERFVDGLITTIEPFVSADDLLNLGVYVRSDATTYLNARDSYPDAELCAINDRPFDVGETRSLFCDEPVYGKSVVLIKNSASEEEEEEESRFHICELEVYSADDRTDIAEPSWSSDWTVIDVNAQLLWTFTHGLGHIPIYGRVLIEVLSGTNAGFVYTDIGVNTEFDGLRLKYSDSEALVEFAGVDISQAYCPADQAWTKTLSPCQSGTCAHVVTSQPVNFHFL